MKTKMTFAGVRLSLLLVGVLAVISCQQNDAPPSDAPGRAVVFVPTVGDIETTVMSRAYDNQWEENDAVGIYMVDPATSPVDLDEDADGEALVFRNVLYRAASAGATTTLTATGTQIAFPSNGDAVNFVAYSPHKESIALAAAPIYPVNVTTQAPLNAIDLIYHNGTTSGDDYNKEDEEVSLVFAHQLAKINFTIIRDPAGQAFTPGTVTYTSQLVGFPRQADFNLSAGTLSNLSGTSTGASPIAPVLNDEETDGETLYFESIIVPHTGSAYSSRTFGITIAGSEYTYTFPTSRSFTAGQEYEYTFRLFGPQLVFTGTTITNWGTNTPVEENLYL